MITFIASPIGSGKSCYSACLAQKAIKRGRSVYSNTEIANCRKITVQQLATMRPARGSLVIIDETGNEFNSRNFAQTSKTLIEFFKLSRHYGIDIILISQTFNDSDKQIRELAQRIYFIRPIISGVISMIVNVDGKIGVGMQGEVMMQYKIAKIGAFCLLPKWFKYYDSFSAPERNEVPIEQYRTYRPETIWVRAGRCGRIVKEYLNKFYKLLNKDIFIRKVKSKSN